MKGMSQRADDHCVLALFHWLICANTAHMFFLMNLSCPTLDMLRERVCKEGVSSPAPGDTVAIIYEFPPQKNKQTNNLFVQAENYNIL